MKLACCQWVCFDTNVYMVMEWCSKWSGLGQLREYLLIGLKPDVPWHVLPCTFRNQWQFREINWQVWTKPPISWKLSLKYEWNQKHEDVITTWKYEKYYHNAKITYRKKEKIKKYRDAFVQSVTGGDSSSLIMKLIIENIAITQKIWKISKTQKNIENIGLDRRLGKSL